MFATKKLFNITTSDSSLSLTYFTPFLNPFFMVSYKPSLTNSSMVRTCFDSATFVPRPLIISSISLSSSVAISIKRAPTSGSLALTNFVFSLKTPSSSSSLITLPSSSYSISSYVPGIQLEMSPENLHPTNIFLKLIQEPTSQSSMELLLNVER